MNRRAFLQWVGAGSVTALSAGSIGQVLAAGIFQPQTVPQDRISHLINRLTFGVTPELYDYVRQIGEEAFIEEQLAPETIDDHDMDILLETFPLLSQSGGQLLADYEQGSDSRREVVVQLLGATLARAIYSKRQLYERMVGFWTDHFNIFIGELPVAFLKLDDDRDVIRRYALGSFRDLLGASAHSPAMLLYLDNAGSRAEHPNENYARELLELHTLGVNGGYTEDDVKEAARAFTGWSIVREQDGGFAPGSFRFRPFFHDNDAKTVLGQDIPAGGGATDGEQVLDILTAHPATAHYLSTKLVRRFVADNPPTALVDQCAATFTQTNGDIRALLRTIFASDEFWNAPPRFKRPFEYGVSLLRAVATPMNRVQGVGGLMLDSLRAMGHVPFQWPTPDGYSDIGTHWMNTLLSRWNLSITLLERGFLNGNILRQFVADHTASTGLDQTADFLARYLFSRDLSADERLIVDGHLSSIPNESERPMALLALLLSAPAFQYF